MQTFWCLKTLDGATESKTKQPRNEIRQTKFLLYKYSTRNRLTPFLSSSLQSPRDLETPRRFSWGAGVYDYLTRPGPVVSNSFRRPRLLVDPSQRGRPTGSGRRRRRRRPLNDPYVLGSEVGP